MIRPSLTKRFAVLGIIASVVLVASVDSACTPEQRGDAKTALDVAQVACIIAHQEMPDSDIAKVCSITEAFLDPMRTLLVSARTATSAAVAKAGAAHADAGCK